MKLKYIRVTGKNPENYFFCAICFEDPFFLPCLDRCPNRNGAIFVSDDETVLL